MYSYVCIRRVYILYIFVSVSWYHITYFQTFTDTSSSFCYLRMHPATKVGPILPKLQESSPGFQLSKIHGSESRTSSYKLLRTHWKFLSQSGVIWWYPETVGNNGMRNTEEIICMQRVMSHESSWISPAVTSKPFIHSTLCLLGIKWPSVGISEWMAESRDLVEHLASRTFFAGA